MEISLSHWKQKHIAKTDYCVTDSASQQCCLCVYAPISCVQIFLNIQSKVIKTWRQLNKEKHTNCSSSTQRSKICFFLMSVAEFNNHLYPYTLITKLKIIKSN
ncbi:hypothetical protein XENOCAPTIV_018055 [Xenoophorus captivus]|uniref:Uncharacterized protein n=1 Tax=Xenoophorus captivus TaxID=1517983 RepID=A0ABV0RW13_9TELE